MLRTSLLVKLILWNLIAGTNLSAQNIRPDQKPNIILILADDMGYGDASVYGHPTIQTPNIDQLAEEGQRWTNFYVAASVCTPSRAALLTGRLPIRNGMCSDKRRVFWSSSKRGLPSEEITIAEALKEVGYTTACIGKWHLGHKNPKYLPISNGFDYYYGIPYSNDMNKTQKMTKELYQNPKISYYNVPLMEGDKIIERPFEQHTATKRYTQTALKFIKENKSSPFFIFLSHSMPHVPLFASESFRGKSERGLYGDVIEEIDWSVGELIRTLQEEGLEENTLVIFTSDNGPWKMLDEHGGSAGQFRGSKGSTWEGGMRVPAIFWWKSAVKHGVIREMAATLDLFPTICSLTGAKFPKDRVMDGYDLTATLLEQEESDRDEMFFYMGRQLFAVRKGNFKLHFKTREIAGFRKYYNMEHSTPLLFNLGEDPSEQYDIAAKYPEKVKELKKLAEEHLRNIEPYDDQIAPRDGDVGTEKF
ncbi:sulfatase [Flagellimonas sp. 389]|nr:sulfatase [Flagellimonas sp. 389]